MKHSRKAAALLDRMTLTARDAAGTVSVPDRARFGLLAAIQPRR